MIRERTRQQSDLKGHDVRVQEMKMTIARNESIIHMLQMQLQQQQQQQQTEHHERQFFLDDASVSQTLHVFVCFFSRPDVTSAVDWVLKANYLSICFFKAQCKQ